MGNKRKHEDCFETPTTHARIVTVKSFFFTLEGEKKQKKTMCMIPASATAWCLGEGMLTLEIWRHCLEAVSDGRSMILLSILVLLDG